MQRAVNRRPLWNRLFGGALLRQSSDDARGFALLEVTVALGILMMLVSMTTTFFMFNLKNNLNIEIRYEAMQAAQAVLDDLRFQDPSTLTTNFVQDKTVANRTYSVAVTYCSISTYCTSTDIKHIDVQVSYSGKLVYETDTVYSKF